MRAEEFYVNEKSNQRPSDFWRNTLTTVLLRSAHVYVWDNYFSFKKSYLYNWMCEAVCTSHVRMVMLLILFTIDRQRAAKRTAVRWINNCVYSEKMD